ncbi:MAG: class I SAM-dependent methyltransferase [Lysobacter sp.]|nr:class I SAM-dependent methyltransferase [Lysobacter sp.]
MPVHSTSRQPERPPSWFSGMAGQAVLESEVPTLIQAFAERPGPPWLWLSAEPQALVAPTAGVALRTDGQGFSGVLRCGTALPLASEAVGTVVLQHVVEGGLAWPELLEECARVLLPGGRLWVFALNPLSPYRRHWLGSSIRVIEPVTWRRRLRIHGLQPEPVSQGIGPRWRVAPAPELQIGAGVRAAYLLRAEKRAIPLTPIRQRAVRWAPGVSAT